MQSSSAAQHGDGLRVIEGGNQDPLIGHTIDGRYEVEKVLGEGGMGLVYRGRHVVLNKPLAIKVLRPDVSKDQEIIQRFKQEAQSASAIGNQHIIDISDFGALPDGSTYFIMEFLDGSDLTKVIERQSPIPVERVVHIAKQLCDALGAAHDAGIVHRDLKPDNIYLIKRGQDSDFVKVLDFGIAKVGGASSKLTRAGQVFGTPHYMSPEQCGGVALDHRTDIYAIGIILYEMVAGRTPFDADNLMAILSKHIYEAPTPPTQFRPDCPPDLEAVVLRCIAKKPDERYGHLRELQDDLRRLEAGMTTSATGRTYSHIAAPAQATVPALPQVVAPQQPKSKAGFVVGGVALLAVLGGGAFLAMKPAPAPVAPVALPTPVVAPATPAEPAAAPAAAAQPVVQILSEPTAAELWSGETMLGQTPLDIPRPAQGQSLQIELRHPGYESKVITISSLTVAPQLRFTLVEARRTGGGSHAPRPANTGGGAPSPSPAPSRPSHSTSETINPWD